ARYRTGAVARMVRMPAATLRVWERRYAVARPQTTAAGHRLYSASDVQRLVLVKQLTEVGHAIGAIAALDMAGLREVAAIHVGASAQTGVVPPPPPSTPAARAWRVVVIGPALGRRLQRPEVLDGLGCPLACVASFDSLAAASASAPRSGRAGVDALLVHQPSLQRGLVEPLQAVARSLGAAATALLYSHASQPVCDALGAAGVALLRAPQSDAALAQWLSTLCRPPLVDAISTARNTPAAATTLVAPAPVLPRRYDDATLADVAALSSTLGCECPRHVAELLMQLSSFEAYSIECARLSAADPKDAALHGHLRQVAGASRALFETALERVAVHEGLVLPMI
ncbi:MAG: MerR family transcriptional regulator, partial [Burkholderiaceae bacterium]